MLFHHFGRFLTEYDVRFEKEHGFLRPIVTEVVERYLDCGNPRSGFALMTLLKGVKSSAQPGHEPKPRHEDCETLPGSAARTATRNTC
ncbi:MAG: hypothetical protein OEW05_13605 [Candidatus Aminicenantes bacterium]|nr:hypothetical protein [Candidatus Aminicenantes bacterium]